MIRGGDRWEMIQQKEIHKKRRIKISRTTNRFRENTVRMWRRGSSLGPPSPEDAHGRRASTAIAYSHGCPARGDGIGGFLTPKAGNRLFVE